MFTTTIALAMLQAASTQAAQTPSPPPPPPCSSDGHAGFDFWVGEWEVFGNASGQRVGESLIERTNNGCAVIENWRPASGNTGTSLNSYNSTTGQWHQKWVGSGGGMVEFVGGVTDGKMVLTGNWPSAAVPHQLIRMSYTLNEDGSVRQFGEGSTDHGLTWQTSFDFLYRPKAGAEEAAAQ